MSKTKRRREQPSHSARDQEFCSCGARNVMTKGGYRVCERTADLYLVRYGVSVKLEQPAKPNE